MQLNLSLHHSTEIRSTTPRIRAAKLRCRPHFSALVVEYAGTIQADPLVGAPAFSDLEITLQNTFAADGFSATGSFSPLNVTVGGDLIPADRLTSWDPGHNSVGGIPVVTTQYGSTITPSGGDDAAAINAAINAASALYASDGILRYVQLSAGTFLVASYPANTKSGVELRGVGPECDNPANCTILNAPATGKPCVIFGQEYNTVTTSGTLLAADAVFGAFTLQLASLVVNGHTLVAGDLVYVNQEPDPAYTILGVLDHADEPYAEPYRPHGQALEVVSVDGGTNTVTFNTPMHHPWSTTYNAHVTMLNSPAVEWAGLRDLTVEYGEGGDGGGNIHIFGAKYCWAYNVQSRYSGGQSFNLDLCFRCTIKHCFALSTIWPFSGGAGYGFGINKYSADCLIEDCISWAFNKTMVMRASGGGNVIAYNYFDDAFGGNYVSTPEMAFDPSHYTTSHHELFEGNRGSSFDTESLFGNSIYCTVFRNWFNGLRRNDPKLLEQPFMASAPDMSIVPGLQDAYNRRCVGLQTASWWFSFVGNVLGFAAQASSLFSGTEAYGFTVNQTTLVYEQPTNDMVNDALVPMWKIGYDGYSWPDTADMTVYDSCYRHGNYDYVTGNIVWDPSVANHTIPDSLYLSGAPAFMSGKTWPWVDPEAVDPILDTLPAYDRFNAWANSTTIQLDPLVPSAAFSAMTINPGGGAAPEVDSSDSWDNGLPAFGLTLDADSGDSWDNGLPAVEGL